MHSFITRQKGKPLSILNWKQILQITETNSNRSNKLLKLAAAENHAHRSINALGLQNGERKLTVSIVNLRETEAHAAYLAITAQSYSSHITYKNSRTKALG